MACPNINSKEWKDLVGKIGTFEAMKEFLANGEEIPSADNYMQTIHGVDAAMRIFTILSTPKTEGYFNRFYNTDKKKFFKELTAQGASKQQVELLRAWEVNNRPATINEMIMGVLAEISFTVEIKTTTGISEDPNWVSEEMEKSEDAISTRNTAHYITMTVPGGTNYSEQEIRTPDITPSIKGHAAFSTDKGIGWFRSDDKVVGIENRKASPEEIEEVRDTQSIQAAKELEKNGLPNLGGTITKARRILEVQSDLFQKGRDKKDLVSIDRDTLLSRGIANMNQYGFSVAGDLQKGDEVLLNNKPYTVDSGEYNYDKGWTYTISDNTDPNNPDVLFNVSENLLELPKAKNTVNGNRKNNFLQLFNKDNNWVTFFVKSIIQDSNRRGYEKVLFPAGDTATKVEGHQTVEQFIKDKQARIDSLRTSNTHKWIYDDINKNYEVTEPIQGATVAVFSTREEAENDYDKRYAERHNREIFRLEEEIEDAKAGRTKFGVINNFYENTVQNILKKQGFNPYRITDEYGNDWFEVNPNGQTVFYQLESVAQKLNMFPDVVKEGILPSAAREEAARREKEEYKKILNKLKSKFGVDWKEDNEMQEIGKYENGIVYINMNKIKSDTPFHEYMHPFEQVIKKKNPILWRSLAVRAQKVQYKGKSIADFVAEKYPELDAEDLLSETIVTAIGLTASDPTNITKGEGERLFKERLMDFIKRLVDYINQLLSNGNVITAEQLTSELSFRNLADILFHSKNKVDASEANTNTTFYQKSDDLFDKLKADQNRIKLDEASHTYTVDGKKVEGGSITDIVKKFYRNLFPEKEKTEEKQFIDELTREQGTSIHKEIESIGAMIVDPATGLKRDTELALPKVITNLRVQNQIYHYLKEKVNSYLTGTRFVFEARIYDAKRDMAGSVDFIAVLPSGDMEIYDWKSIQTGKGIYKKTELPWYKEQAYRIQLSEYKDVLEKTTGAKVTYAAAIPIEANTIIVREDTSQFDVPVKGKIVDVALPDVKFGALDPRTIAENEDYLVPIVLQEQSTGDVQIDKLIKALYAIYEKTQNEKVGDVVKKYEKAEKLRSLAKAIRDLQVKKDIKSFVENGTNMILTAADRIKNQTLDSGSIEDYIDDISVYKDSQEYLARLLLWEDAITEDVKTQFSLMQTRANLVLGLLKQERINTAQKMANPIGINDVSKAEKKIDMLKGLFRSISTLDTKAIRLFYNKLRGKQNERDLKTKDQLEELANLKTELLKIASAKGISPEHVFDKIMQFDSKGRWLGKFITKYDPKYYTDKNKALEEKDLDWFKNNAYFDKESYEKALAKITEYINIQQYSTDYIVNEAKRKAALDNWIISHNAEKFTDALFSPRNGFVKPQDKNLSTQWKELQKKENEVLKKVYDKFQEILRESHQIGMLDEETNTFIPNIEASKLDRIIFSGTKDLVNVGGLFDKLEVRSAQGFGQINPITGKQIHKVPVYFTESLGVKKKDGNTEYIDFSGKSRDLFKVFGTWAAHMYHYDAMKTMEDDAHLILQMEKNKDSLVTNKFGKVKIDKITNRPVEKKGNEDNAKVLEDFINYYVYGKNMDSDSDISFTINGKEYSAIKSVRSLMQYMSIKTLGFNALSASANLFGGSANAFLTASKRVHMNEKDWVKGSYLFSTKDKKAFALLGYFDIFLEDLNIRRADALSVNKILATATADKFFVLQRSTDKAVQYPVFLAMTFNYMVNDGKIVNIKDYVKKQNNYDGVYSRMTISEKKVLDKKINAEVEELKTKSSIYATAKVEDDKLVVPGLDLTSEEVGKFRSRVRKVNKGILGNSTHDDINRARLSLVGQIMMQFRSWIPQLVTERFGSLSYDQDLETYSYGRARLFFKNFISPKFFQLTKELILGFGVNTIDRAKEVYVKMVEDAAANGEEFTMTETEFIDKYLGDIRAQMRELEMLLALTGLLFSVNPGEEPDEDKKGMKKLLARAFNKYQDEIGFYYTPSSFSAIIKSPIPIIGVLQDIANLTTNTLGNIYGYAVSDEEIIKSNHPFKYLGKLFPISKEAMQWYGAFDSDFRKENDINL